MSGLRTITFALLALTMSLPGCSSPEKPAVVDRYDMRGEILRLPAAGSRELFIKHDAVPGFKDESGKVVGMEAMSMPFTVAEGVSLAGLAPGDPVNFTLEVDWSAEREPIRIVRVEKLAPLGRIDLESGALPAAQGNETPR